MKYNGSSWGYVGYQGFSAGDAAYVSLVLNGSTPVVAYQDIANSNEPAVMYYRSFFNDWNEATKYFAYAGASQIAGTIFDGDPLFAYEDWGVNKASAMEYSGGNMLDAGSRGFSPGETSYNSLAANESTAYLAFRDADSSYKATVMTYDGSAWSLFGSAGISGGVANYTSIALDDLTPYLAYVDGFYSNGATVRKHSGLGWEYVGTGGFTPGNVDQTNLALDEYTPYIAFIDIDNGNGVTVMKYVPKTYQLFLPLIVR
jgi:hypothetical protein